MTNTFRIITLSIYCIVSLIILLLTIYNHMFAILIPGMLISGGLFLGFLSNKLRLTHYTMILIPIIVLSPIIKVPGFFADVRLDDLWLFFGGMILCVRVAIKRNDRKIIIPSYAKLFIIFILWISITIFISSYREPYLYSSRDWTEIYKGLKLLAYLLIAVNLKLDFIKQKKIINVLLVSLLISAIFGILQYFNIANINSWLTKYYIFETKIYNLEVQRRVIGTFGNPNIFGIALIIGIALSFSSLFGEFKKRYLLALFIFFIALTMSLSRTSLIVSIMLVAIMAFKIFWKTKRKVITLFYLSFIPLIALLGLQFAPGLFFRRLVRVTDISSDASFQGRLSMWEDIWYTRTKINLLTGTGPVSNIRITFDNEWLELLTHYGIIGVGLFFITFWLMYRKLGKMDGIKINFYNIAVQGLLIVLAISMWMFTIFNILQLMPIIILLIGIALNENVRKEMRITKSLQLSKSSYDPLGEKVDLVKKPKKARRRLVW